MCPMIDPAAEERPQLPPGLYNARIVACDMKPAKTGGHYLNWKFEVGPSRQWVYLMNGLTGKGLEKLKMIVRAAKYPDYQGGPINTDELLGLSVQVQVERGWNPDGSESPYMQVTDVRAMPEAFDAFDR